MTDAWRNAASSASTKTFSCSRLVPLKLLFIEMSEPLYSRM
jgi:hypothetical protein